jgi:phage tail protein X
MELGKRRAHSVAEEFIMEHGIDSTRIKEIGKGIIRGRRSTAAYSPNRRAVIKLMTEEEFEKSHGKRPAANQTVSENKTIVVKRGDTLGKIARDYYGNSNCWIYIFENNRDVMATPNKARAGMEIKLPVLTEKQMLIKKAEAEQRYEKYKP